MQKQSTLSSSIMYGISATPSPSTGTIQAIQWLNQVMDPVSSCLIAREVFVNWAKMNLRRDTTIVHYSENLDDGVSLASSLGYKNNYWIWWNDNGTGQLWYGQPVPATFTPIHQEGNIAIYKYSRL